MNRGKRPPEESNLSIKERLAAIMQVARISFATAPLAVFVQGFSAAFNAVLPIATTFFAARTTTALAAAFNGDQAEASRVIEYVVITAILGILSSVWSTIQNYIQQLLQYRIEAAVSDRMYEHFLRIEFWRYDDKDTMDTYDKAIRFANFFPYIFSRFGDIFSQVIGLIVAVIALIFVNWWIGLIVVVALVPSFVIQSRISRAQSAHWKKNVDTRRAVGMIEWNLLQPPNMAELRLYSMARHLIDLRANLRDKDDKIRIDFERQYLWKRFAADAISAVAEVAALVWIALQITKRLQPIGQFIYVQQLVSRSMGSASQLITTINSIDEDLANLVEYRKFSEMPEASEGDRVFTGLTREMSLEHVSFQYPESEHRVLKDVSMTIAKGQHVAIVGENGAGKSTLVKLMTGLYRPTTGAMLVDSTPLEDYTVSSWHNQLAVLQQDYLAYGFATAKDNVYYGDVQQPFDKARFDEALKMAEAKEFLDELPRGVDNYVLSWMEDDSGNKGVNLSGGQWQRLALARNFYRDSPIIILDEPTSAVDALAEARIFKHIFAKKDKTIIMISHRLSTIKKADVIYMLKDGNIVEQGSYTDLIEAHGEFYTMFEAQM